MLVLETFRWKRKSKYLAWKRKNLLNELICELLASEEESLKNECWKNRWEYLVVEAQWGKFCANLLCRTVWKLLSVLVASPLGIKCTVIFQTTITRSIMRLTSASSSTINLAASWTNSSNSNSPEPSASTAFRRGSINKLLLNCKIQYSPSLMMSASILSSSWWPSMLKIVPI